MNPAAKPEQGVYPGSKTDRDGLRLSCGDDARIAINQRGRIRIINPREVLTVIAQGNYVVLESASHTLRLRESISVVADRLAAHGFVRIHRSVLVNRTSVREIHPYAPGRYLVRLTSGKEFTTTRTYRKNLKSLAEVWLGDETLIGS